MQIQGIELENVIYKIDLAKHEFSDLLESEYIGKIIRELALTMGNCFYNYQFVIYSRPAYRKGIKLPVPIPFEKSNKKQIIIYLSDELFHVPDKMADQAFAIFKHRLPPGFTHRNIFPLPVGYNKTTKHQNVIPIGQRKFNVFFFGQLSSGRLHLYKSLAGINWIPDLIIHKSKKILKITRTNFDSAFSDSFIRFTSSFQKGFGADHYATTLYNSKIALCPYGNVGNMETFRHYEAMRAGNVIITAPMPKFSFYNNSPMVVIERWSELSKVVKALLKDPKRLEDIHLKTLDWWETHCSEHSVATYIARSIHHLEKKSIHA